MADYISTLTGVQMDNALLDMAEHNSEAYAVGERAGVPVDTSDVTYHNNSRYYAQLATSAIVGDATSAVRWDTDQSTALTDAQKAVARNNIDAGKNGAWTNPNLLDNSWFLLNSRGQSSYTGNVYGLDRWRGGNSRTTITVNTGYITLSTNSSGNGILRQILPQTYEGTYTFSAVVGGSGSGALFLQDGGGTIIGDAVTFTTTGSTQLVTLTFTTSGAAIGGVAVRVDVSNSIDAVCAKLEKGSVSTLANDTPPDYGEELTRCIYSTADPTDTYANNGFGRTNPNLLDNPWWNSGNVINQRGFTNGTSSGYTIDRWALTNSSVVTATLGASGMTIAKAGTGNYTFFHQWINTEIDRDATYTLSVMDSNGNIYSATRQFVTGAGSESYVTINGMNIGFGLYNKEATHPRVAFYFGTNQTGSVTFKAVKLELGSVSTLANDTPPNYAEELAKCQRYFFRLKMESNRCYAVGFAESTTSVRIALPVPSPMRTDPTVTTSGTIRFKGNGGLLTPSAFATSNSYPPDATARINCTVSGATQYQLYALSANDSSTYIDLSADL